MKLKIESIMSVNNKNRKNSSMPILKEMYEKKHEKREGMDWDAGSYSSKERRERRGWSSEEGCEGEDVQEDAGRPAFFEL